MQADPGYSAVHGRSISRALQRRPHAAGGKRANLGPWTDVKHVRVSKNQLEPHDSQAPHVVGPGALPYPMPLILGGPVPKQQPQT